MRQNIPNKNNTELRRILNTGSIFRHSNNHKHPSFISSDLDNSLVLRAAIPESEHINQGHLTNSSALRGTAVTALASPSGFDLSSVRAHKCLLPPSRANTLASSNSTAKPLPAPSDGRIAIKPDLTGSMSGGLNITGPSDGPANTSITGSFLATRYSYAAPAFGKVAWNTHEPLASYSGWLDGNNWRFRLDTLALRVPVGVASGGRTNINGANSPEVKKTTWSTVESDLRPAGGTPNRSPRSTYWAEDLTWKHEVFHFDEFNGFLNTSFSAYETEIEGSGYTEAKRSGDTVVDALARKQPDLNNKLLAAWNEAKTNMSPNMETRAYADGVAAYTARADAVKARATTEGW